MIGNFPSNRALTEIIEHQSTLEPVSALTNVYKYDSGTRRKRPKLSKDEYILGSMELIRECIESVLQGDKLSISFDECYRFVENNCKNGHMQVIYNDINTRLEQYWETTVCPQVISQLNGKNCIENLLQCWENWDSKLQKLKLIFMYLENSYCIYSKSKVTIKEMGRKLFCDSILKLNKDNTGTRIYEPNELKTRYMVFEDFINISVNYLQKKQDGDLLNKFISLIKLLDTDESIGFTSLIQDLVVKVFDQVGTIELNDDYISQSLCKIKEFGELLQVYFVESESYSDSIIFKMEKVLLFDKLELICSQLLPRLFVDKQREVLLLYREFTIWDQDLTTFARLYSKAIQEQIKQLIEKDDDDIISQLLIFKDECYSKHSLMFQKNEIFEMNLREAFKRCINSGKILPIIIDRLNKYIVQQIKDHHYINANAWGEPVVIILDEPLKKLKRFEEIYKIIEDKTLFIEYYSIPLSRRLIFNKTEPQVEEYAIELMTKISGPENTKQLWTMVQDIIESRKFMSKLPHSNTGFEALTLSSLNWASLLKKQESHNKIFQISQNLKGTIDNFDQYWLSQSDNKHKSLKWLYNLSSITLMRQFKNGEKEIFANFLQGCILLLFNDNDSLSYEDIAMQLQLQQEPTLLQTNLNSLIKGKYKILIQKSSNYQINEDFKSKTNIIRLSTGITTTTTTTTRKPSIHQSLEYEEKLQALIMRILKKDRKLKHNALLNKVIQVYPVDSTQLKPIIEKLIHQEYLKRSLVDEYEYIP